MKRKSCVLGLASVAFLLMSVAAAFAQHEHHGQQKPPAQTGAQTHMQHGSTGTSRLDEPHDTLAIAHLQNVATFARALNAQVEAKKAVDAAYAQAAVAEIRRNFYTMQQHLTFYRRVMPADTTSHGGMQSQAAMHSHSGAQSNTSTQSHSGMHSHTPMAQLSDDHIAEVRQALELLEREVYSDAPRADKVSERAAAIVKHIEMMTMSHSGHNM